MMVLQLSNSGSEVGSGLTPTFQDGQRAYVEAQVHFCLLSSSMSHDSVQNNQLHSGVLFSIPRLPKVHSHLVTLLLPSKLDQN